MFRELKEELKAIRDDVNAIKKAPEGLVQSEIDDIESLFSSLDNSHLSSSPFIQQPGMLSPPGPSASATAPLFRPRANSLPPIYLEPYLDQLPASKAQHLRLQSPTSTSTSQPFLVTSDHESQGTSASASASASASIAAGHGSQPQSSGVQLHVVTSPPLLSPPCQSQPTFSMGSLAPIAIRASSQTRAPAQHRQPLPIPGYMPIKTAEELVARYPNYLNEENIGRLATKLAQYTYFGENVLAQSIVPGGGDKHPLNPVVLLQMKNMLKGQFPNESPTDFECKWAKCVDSINRLCKYIYNTK